MSLYTVMRPVLLHEILKKVNKMLKATRVSTQNVDQLQSDTLKVVGLYTKSKNIIGLT